MKDSVGSVDDKSISKAEQLLQNIYSKTANIIVNGRTPCTSKKLNKWFNLEEVDSLKEELKLWREFSIKGSMPPLIIQIYLDTSKLHPLHMLLLKNESTGRYETLGNDQLADFENDTPIRKKSILLESWQLTLAPSGNSQKADLPLIYKKHIAFFRRLYFYIRLMPSFRLKKRMEKGDIGFKSHQLGYRISNSRENIPNEAGLDQLHLSGNLTNGIVETNFGAMETPFGLANLHVTFRRDCDFRIDTSDLILAERFADVQDEYFSVNQGHVNVASSVQRAYLIQRKSSTASFSTDSEPPKSYTAPSFEFRAGSLKSHDIIGQSLGDSQNLRFRSAGNRRSSITPGSLPSPSILAFTPPSVTSSFRNNVGSYISNRDIPPFSTAPDFKPDFINSTEGSPPFALGGIMASVKSHVSEKPSDAMVLLRQAPVSQSLSMSIRPDSEMYSISAPQQYVFSPRHSSVLIFNRNQRNSPPAFTIDQALLFRSEESRNKTIQAITNESQDSRNTAIDSGPYIKRAKETILRFKQLKETNLVFAASILGSSSTKSFVGDGDDDLLFAMSELDH